MHLRRERLGVAIQQAWILLQDLHQLSAVQGGRLGRARARRMESLMRVCAPLTVMPHLLHVLQLDGIWPCDSLQAAQIVPQYTLSDQSLS